MPAHTADKMQDLPNTNVLVARPFVIPLFL